MSGETSIVVACACGKKLKAPATAVGKKARCPACGGTVLVTAGAKPPPVATAARASAVAAKPPAIGIVSKAPPPPRKAPPPMPAKAPADDGLDALYDLAQQAQSATPIIDGAQCPQCSSAMPDGAVLCTQCGYDTRTGKALAKPAVAKAAPAKSSFPSTSSTKSKKPVDLMAPQGSFVMGVVLSAAFALAASLVWIGVAWATGLAIGYIAILIGGAAGAGMQIGQKGHSRAGGVTAAGMTLVAILIAKLVVLELVISRAGINVSVFNLDGAKLAAYFFTPIGVIIMLVGMGAAFRTANGSVSG